KTITREKRARSSWKRANRSSRQPASRLARMPGTWTRSIWRHRPSRGTRCGTRHSSRSGFPAAPCSGRDDKRVLRVAHTSEFLHPAVGVNGHRKRSAAAQPELLGVVLRGAAKRLRTLYKVPTQIAQRTRTCPSGVASGGDVVIIGARVRYALSRGRAH